MLSCFYYYFRTEPKSTYLKLTKSIQLFFQEGNSDKVYEIDLIESGEDAFVVNFRYGRRGAVLKEGTKTVFPVSHAEAIKIFDALEEEKRKKGYIARGDDPSLIIPSVKLKASGSSDSKRDKAVIKNLKAAINEEESETWPLSRIIWRAGELKLKDASSLVLKLIDKTDLLLLYSCIRTLGRIGDQKCVSFLIECMEGQFPSYIKNLSLAAVSNIIGEEQKKSFLESVYLKLPESIRTLLTLEKGVPESYLIDIFSRFGSGINEFAIPLYIISRTNEALSVSFKKALIAMPVKGGYFKTIRQLYKTSEMLDDTEIYALLVKKMEKAPSNFSSADSHEFINGKWGPVINELKKEDSTLAFSKKTKEYFSRRTVRTLRKSGMDESSLYTKYATSILLSYNDKEDNCKIEKKVDTNYLYNSSTRSYTTTVKTTWYDTHSEHLSLYYILYANSTRYELKKGAKRWQCVDPFEPGKATEPLREEAFARLWNKAPEDIIRLLAISNCTRVSDFALNVFNTNSSFKEFVTEEHLAGFLRNISEKVQQLGFDLVKERFAQSVPPFDIVVALLLCSITEAIEAGEKWVESNPTKFVESVSFQVAMMLSDNPISQKWLEYFLKKNKVSSQTGAEVISRIINVITAHDYMPDEKQVSSISEFIESCYSESVPLLFDELVFNLFLHPNQFIHALAGKLLVLKKLKAESVPDKIIFALLQSESMLARGAGVDLLNNLTDLQLLEKKNLVLSLCLSPIADLRQAAQKLIDKLLLAEPASGSELVGLFLPVLTIKEKYDGLHADILSLLTVRLSAHLKISDRKKIILLCSSRYIAAQELGLILLKTNVVLRDLSIQEIISLAGSGLLETRQLIINYFTDNVSRIKQEKKQAVLLADVSWEDVRRFAFDFFRKEFTDTEWSADMFITLCDSINEDVQAFGREMINKWFEKDNGFEYLMKLSQHPDSRMQLFASGFLDNYAKNNSETLEKLQSFFITLLSQVNKGHTAKVRAIDLLHKEALENEKNALIAATVFNRMSASASITDKALYIKALTDIRKKYNTVDVVLKIKATPVYENEKVHGV